MEALREQHSCKDKDHCHFHYLVKTLLSQIWLLKTVKRCFAIKLKQILEKGVQLFSCYYDCVVFVGEDTPCFQCPSLPSNINSPVCGTPVNGFLTEYGAYQTKLLLRGSESIIFCFQCKGQVCTRFMWPYQVNTYLWFPQREGTRSADSPLKGYPQA